MRSGAVPKVTPKVTLDQWRVFQAIVDEGGFAQAAQVLHRSQSSVSYAARRLQEVLGIRLLAIQGRRAELTEAGNVLLERSRLLIEQAASLEKTGSQLRQGWEANIRLVVENVLPTDILLETLKQFEPLSRGTRIHLSEEVLSGVEDAMTTGSVDLAISPIVPSGYLYENLTEVAFIAVAHRDHALHYLPDQPLRLENLKQSIHIVVRDSGARARDAGWVQAEQKWTVSSFSSAIDMVARGLGFAWLPQDHISPLIQEGILRPLKLEKGGVFHVPVNLIYAKADHQGPATNLLIEIIKRVVHEMKENHNHE